MKALRLASLAWLLCASPAFAGGNDGTVRFETFDLEPIIADCWQRSEELRGMGSAAAYGDGLNITQNTAPPRTMPNPPAPHLERRAP
jgi:hypothetical protein